MPLRDLAELKEAHLLRAVWIGNRGSLRAKRLRRRGRRRAAVERAIGEPRRTLTYPPNASKGGDAYDQDDAVEEIA